MHILLKSDTPFIGDDENITLSIILGMRPEIIKMSPVISECERRGLEYFILHTGQHYSYNMDRVFFEQLGLPEARYNLEAGSGGAWGADGEDDGGDIE